MYERIFPWLVSQTANIIWLTKFILLFRGYVILLMALTLLILQAVLVSLDLPGILNKY